VIDVSGCAVSFAEQTALEMRNTARQAGLDEAGVAEVLELHRLAGRYAAGGRWEPYAVARERALQGPIRSVAEGFPHQPDLPLWTFLRKVGGFDPLPAWLLVDVPALVFYGAEDERDNVPVEESVRRLERAFALSGSTPPEIHVIPGVGHALLETPERFAPAFTDGLARWIEETLHP
jgi:pimeloyl-ACP methyl ester carboxylesterase